jgi:hypothetical protein
MAARLPKSHFEGRAGWAVSGGLAVGGRGGVTAGRVPLTLNGSGSGADILEFFDTATPNSETLHPAI